MTFNEESTWKQTICVFKLCSGNQFYCQAADSLWHICDWTRRVFKANTLETTQYQFKLNPQLEFFFCESYNKT